MTSCQIDLKTSVDEVVEASWSDIERAGRSDEAATYTVLYEPRVTLGDHPSIALVRIIRVGTFDVSEVTVWRHPVASAAGARRADAWMQSRRDDWQFWGRLTSTFGPAGFIEMLDSSIAEERARRLETILDERARARSKRARQDEESRVQAEKEKEVESYIMEEDGQYGIDLRRGGHRKGFFVIWFRERWERERFRDWFRPQRHRWTEFARIYDENGSEFLERMLLREMLETEKRVKKLGMGAGGRRPLRFYRGDE